MYSYIATMENSLAVRLLIPGFGVMYVTRKSNVIMHMGKNDVIMHCKSKSHLEQAKALNSQPKLSFQSLSTSED